MKTIRNQVDDQHLDLKQKYTRILEISRGTRNWMKFISFVAIQKVKGQSK